MSPTSTLRSDNKYSHHLMERITEGLLERGRDLFDSPLYVNWKRKLGCGAYGCAYGSSVKGITVKITDDPVEAPMCVAIMDTGLDKDSRGLARLYGAWRIRIKDSSPVYVILREDIQPAFESDEMNEVLDQAPWVGSLYDVKSAGDDQIEQWGMDVADLEDDLWDALEEGELQGYEETEPLYSALQDLYDQGLFVWDIHAGNLAYRIYPDGNQGIERVTWYDGRKRPYLLLYDYGHSYIKTSGEQRMKSLMQNPVYRDAVKRLEDL